jgi:hypothetical protein
MVPNAKVTLIAISSSPVLRVSPMHRQRKGSKSVQSLASITLFEASIRRALKLWNFDLLPLGFFSSSLRSSTMKVLVLRE